MSIPAGIDMSAWAPGGWGAGVRGSEAFSIASVRPGAPAPWLPGSHAARVCVLAHALVTSRSASNAQFNFITGLANVQVATEDAVQTVENGNRCCATWIIVDPHAADQAL